MRSHWLLLNVLVGLFLLEGSVAGSNLGADQPSDLQPRPTSYETFSGTQLSLYAWVGTHVAILTPEAERDPAVMKRLLQVFDQAYEYYHHITGKEPEPDKIFEGRSIIAVVVETCGAGCGNVGFTGIELLKNTFEVLYSGVRDRNEFDQVVFYELGRNFWFFEEQVQYKKPDDQDSVPTGYAVLMRFLSMDNAGVRPGPFNGVKFSKFRSTVVGLVKRYEADRRLTWSNTLRVGKAPDNSLRLGSTDLFASFLMRLTRAFGSEFPARLWPAVATRPPARTTQEAIDNLVLAACAATSKNLTEIFAKRWRWPVSDTAKAEAQSKFGRPIRLP